MIMIMIICNYLLDVSTSSSSGIVLSSGRGQSQERLLVAQVAAVRTPGGEFETGQQVATFPTSPSMAAYVPPYRAVRRAVMKTQATQTEVAGVASERSSR